MTDSAASLGQQDVLTRVKRVFSMGIATNVLTLATNFLLPPYFLHHLGVDRYGAWLYLFSIPTSLAMADLGVSAAFSTEVFKLHTEGRRDQAISVFKTGVKILAILMLVVFLAALLIVLWQRGQSGVMDETGLTILLLSAYMLSGYVCELQGAAYKINGRYEFTQKTGLIAKLGELVAILVLAPGNDFAAMALALLLIRSTVVLYVWFDISRVAGYLLKGSWRGWAPVGHLFVPALMYAVGPLIMFVALQVPLVVIGHVSTAAAVVAYTTTRTMARLPLQISSQISFSLQTEYTRLLSSGHLEWVEKLHRKSILMILGLFALALAGGELLGSAFYELWLHRTPQSFHIVFAILTLDAIFESMMRNRILLFASLNVHARDTLFHLAVASLAACAMYFAGLWFKELVPMLLCAGGVVGLGLARVLLRSWQGKATHAMHAVCQQSVA